MSGTLHGSRTGSGTLTNRRHFLAAASTGLSAALAAPHIALAQSAPSLAVVGKEGWLFPLWDKIADDDAPQVRPVVQVISRAVATLKAAGIDVAMVLVPSKARTYRQFLPDSMRVASTVDRRYAGVQAEFRKAGAITPDLDTAFRAHAAGTQLFFKTDTHWTPMGAELAAVEAAKAIGPTLPASARPGLQVSAPISRVAPRGDLVRNLPEAQRATYGAEPFVSRDVVASGGQNALLADDTSDVTLVGNSYMEPKYGFQPILSNQLSRPVSLFWKPNNIGAYAILLQYVTSPGFREQRPKLLIWTYLEVDLTAGPSSSGWGNNAMGSDQFLNNLRQAVSA
ncbi:hypothetical protein D9599_19005 [Roseomonas sp. KE2513]|uniref:alginate O-acetyltransferase AlgX-related protein n=1 Tax=Roseomonas sp. KE2513 TaxID=2479202 RepID=UPI0018DF281B|nr:hypothetical protein [Roseomonas sp. KE2513]MBI0537652.1 hypothetical protein [Roseomonas sp. KE2513]